MLPPFHRPWSRRKWLAVVAVALFLLLLYSVIAPGSDFFGCYTWMVKNPEKLPQVADYPWTLNPTWLVPFMAPFVSLPGKFGYIFFMAASLAMVTYGTYVFGGKVIPTLLSGQMWWVLWWGQIEGWGVLGLVLGWFAMQSGSWLMMALALAMASFKPQVGLIPVVYLWWCSGRDRWKSLALMVVVALLSLVIWGPWPLWYLQGISKFVGDQHFGPWNASIGYIVLPLYLPALLIPLRRDQRLAALTATTLLVSPYLPYYSTILLLCFNLPWWAYIFAFTSYLPGLIGTRLAWNAVVLLPLSVLVWLYLPPLRAAWSRWRERRSLKKGNLDG